MSNELFMEEQAYFCFDFFDRRAVQNCFRPRFLRFEELLALDQNFLPPEKQPDWDESSDWQDKFVPFSIAQ